MRFPLTKKQFHQHLLGMKPRQIAGHRGSVCDCPLARAAPDWRQLYDSPPRWASNFMNEVDHGDGSCALSITAGKCLQIGRELGHWD